VRIGLPDRQRTARPGVMLTVQGASAGTQVLDASDLARLR
jgi:hypothetical protein